MTAPLVVTYGAVCTSICSFPRCSWEFNGAVWGPMQVDSAVPAARAHTDATGHRVDIERVVRTVVTPMGGYAGPGPSVPLDDLDRRAS